MSFSLADALKGVSELDTGREQIEYIRLNLIGSDANNFYQLSEIEGLADNISLCGLQQPIRVRQNPENPERYTIVSGHRRRAAIELLAEEDPDKWQEVPCIVERDAVSPALQQLRLIYANANTRKMTSSEISEQAVQVEKLLYQLKEEEGYEFPGRMRDHVAQAVGVSKTKLARLKVIRENLIEKWLERYQNNQLNESTAYALAKISQEYQLLIFEGLSSANRLSYLYECDIDRYQKRFSQIESLDCGQECGMPCINARAKMMKSVNVSLYEPFYCNKCCSDCPNLKSCKMACPKLADKVKKLKDDARAAKREEKTAQEEKERPKIQKIQQLWSRFGYLRQQSGKSVKNVMDAAKMYYGKSDDKMYQDLEDGYAKVSVGTTLPYSYNFALTDVERLISLADLFGCSLDFMLCRTDYPELVKEAPLGKVPNSGTEENEPAFIPGAWYSTSVEPSVGKKLILMDSGGYVDTGKYKGCGEYDMDYGDPVVLWTPMPEEKDVVTESPPIAGWQGGTPKAYGTYVAYIRLDGVSSPLLRELLWDGEEWFLFGKKISEDVTVQCWAERPDF